MQMLIGTAPVIAVLSPCVLAGAFLARVVPGEESMYSMLANGFLALSVVGQMGSMCMAVYSITKVIDVDQEELSRPRAEHAAVAALTASEANYMRSYKEVTDWGTLKKTQKAVVLLAAVFMLWSGMIFAFLDTTCFENFSVSSRISDDLDENGLGGNVLNIIKTPGYGALLMFAVAVLLHIIFVKSMERATLKNMKSVKVYDETTEKVNNLVQAIAS